MDKSDAHSKIIFEYSNLINMKRLKLKWLILLAACGIDLVSVAQSTLKLEECYKLAETNYPLVKQRELLAKSKEYSLDNISRGVWPKLNISGQATYQSDVTKLPISFPGVNIPTLSKDQYKLYGEVNQPISELFLVKDQKALQEANSSIRQENLEVELYRLKDRINQLFFGALMIDEQIRQNELLKKDIQTGINRINAFIKNGTDFKVSLDKMSAELLKTKQHDIELTTSKRAYLDMLGLFLGKPMDEKVTLQKPQSVSLIAIVKRPELSIFDFQKKSYEMQNRLITAKNLPNVGLFFQGGTGRPSPVNMLSNSLSPYYIGGVRLNWSLSGLYTYKKERRIVSIENDLLDAQKETFLFNTNLTLNQQNGEINKLQELLKTDDQIVELRVSVKNTASVQLENGVITTNDYLKEINAEDQARQNRLLHEMQLLMAQYNYQNTSGN